MMKIIILFLSILIIVLFSCGDANPPDEEDDYNPVIIYRVQSTTNTSCPLIEYTNENGTITILPDENVFVDGDEDLIGWEYQMTVEDNAYLSLHAQHTQTPEMAGTADGASGSYYLIDSAANFSTLEDTSTVLNGTNNILHQISAIMDENTLKLNLDTFVGGDTYEIYDRMYYVVAIYRVDETGREDPLVYTEQLYSSMDTTIETYAYKK